MLGGKGSVVCLFSLLDRKLREYGAVIASKNEETMRRDLVNRLRGSGTLEEKYSEDFDLYLVGEFAVETGVLTACEVPELVDNLRMIIEEALREQAPLPLENERRV